MSIGWPCSLTFIPFLRSSPAFGSSSNTPKRRADRTERESFMINTPTGCQAGLIVALVLGSIAVPHR
jgi:hypothetical protein